MNAIHLFTHDEPAIKKWRLKSKSYRKILTKYLEIKKLFEGKKFIYSHIKAHKTTSTPVTFVQQWCDDTAKSEMHKKLTQLNKPSNKKIEYKKPYSELRKPNH